ncbi:MAG: cytochrome c [Gemmatimonadales bacterium]
MSRLREALRQPFWQAVIILVICYMLFVYGIQYLPPLFGFESAPAPMSLIVEYMGLVIVGVLIYVSRDEENWEAFKAPIHRTLVDPNRKPLRGALLVAVPLAVGWVTYTQARPNIGAAAQLRSIHPAPPARITFRGRTIEITGLENPLRHQGSLEEHNLEGRRVYYQNCLPCHGDLLDGQGHFAAGFNPVPLAFDDPGTIAQLTESFVFWRIAKGGPGLPREGTPWNSAMPAWEEFLTEDEIWSVIIFLYEQSGWEPRTWEEGGEGGGHD